MKEYIQCTKCGVIIEPGVFHVCPNSNTALSIGKISATEGDMKQVFLRMENAQTDNNGDAICMGISGRWCYHWKTAKKYSCSHGGDCGSCIFVEDTIIPQKLALYEEMRKMIIRLHKWLPTNACSDEMESIIDRAKKIEEATQ